MSISIEQTVDAHCAKVEKYARRGVNRSTFDITPAQDSEKGYVHPHFGKCSCIHCEQPLFIAPSASFSVFHPHTHIQTFWRQHPTDLQPLPRRSSSCPAICQIYKEAVISYSLVQPLGLEARHCGG